MRKGPTNRAEPRRTKEAIKKCSENGKESIAVRLSERRIIKLESDFVLRPYSASNK